MIVTTAPLYRHIVVERRSASKQELKHEHRHIRADLYLSYWSFRTTLPAKESIGLVIELGLEQVTLRCSFFKLQGDGCRGRSVQLCVCVGS